MSGRAGMAVVVLLTWAGSTQAGQATTGGATKFFVAGGWLVWLVLLPLSLLTVSLVAQFLLRIRRQVLSPPSLATAAEAPLRRGQVQQAAQLARQSGGFLGAALAAALEQVGCGREAMDLAAIETLEQETTTWLRRIEWLNIIGNVAPMLGLFGTVWGMIEAFDGIVRAGGQPQPADLAGGISVALVTTWWGLLVGIPALAAFGVLRNRIDALAAETAVTVEHLLSFVEHAEAAA